MTVSVIIPIYNVARYLQTCLLSVANQTWKGDIKCILVDDCSEDGSREIAETFISNYSGAVRFHLIHHEINKGLSEARNTGLDHATGEYVIFIDSDDYISPDCLKLLVEEAKKHGSIDIVHGGSKSIPDKEYYHKKGLKNIDHLANDEIKDHFFELSINAWNKLISLSFIRKHNLRFAPGLIHEDELWSFYLYRNAESIAFVHEVTYIHIIRESSIMTTLSESVERDSWHEILSEVFCRIENPFHSRIEVYYLNKFFSHFDKDPIWNDIVLRIDSLLQKSNRTIDRLFFRRYIDSGEEFYRNMILDNYFHSSCNKIYHLTRHQLSKLFHNIANS